jgi:hypothetical protein
MGRQDRGGAVVGGRGGYFGDPGAVRGILFCPCWCALGAMVRDWNFGAWIIDTGVNLWGTGWVRMFVSCCVCCVIVGGTR